MIKNAVSTCSKFRTGLGCTILPPTFWSKFSGSADQGARPDMENWGSAVWFVPASDDRSDTPDQVMQVLYLLFVMLAPNVAR
jgi:hypothetical protein